MCLAAQTLPKPTAPAVPPAPTMTTPEGVTVPLTIIAAPVLPPDRVVFQVGDVQLTAAQVDQILLAFSETQRALANGPGRHQFIDQVVNALLLSEEARRRKLDQGEAYKNQIMFSAASLLSFQASEEIKRGVQADEPALRAYYEAHRSAYEQIHLRHILIRAQGASIALRPGEKELTDVEALAKARETRQRLADGADFAGLALLESADTVSAPKGGDLGWVQHGQTLPSLEEGAFALKDAELSQPVKSAFGYHILRVDERKPVKTFEDVRPEIEKTLTGEAIRKLLDSLKAKTKVVVDPDFSTTVQSTAGPRQ
jgi:peptidyl-prolyl cis-trans isomerase C